MIVEAYKSNNIELLSNVTVAACHSIVVSRCSPCDIIVDTCVMLSWTISDLACIALADINIKAMFMVSTTHTPR